MNARKTISRLAKRFGYSTVKSREIPTTVAGKPPAGVNTVNDASVQAHMFWAYGEFSTLEKLSAISFVANGFRLKLWSYGEIRNVPPGVELCDAREIIPENRVFTHRNGSYAAFADLFRYALLSQEGGLWADTDVICLVPAHALMPLGERGFLVTERTRDKSVQINVNVIHHPAPTSGDIIDLARVLSDRFPVDKMAHADIGPKLVTMLVKSYPVLAPAIMSPEFANPVDWWDCPMRLISGAGDVPEGTWFLHGYNEMWRRAGTDKNAPYPKDSILGKVFARYEDRF